MLPLVTAHTINVVPSIKINVKRNQPSFTQAVDTFRKPKVYTHHKYNVHIQSRTHDKVLHTPAKALHITYSPCTTPHVHTDTMNLQTS